MIFFKQGNYYDDGNDDDDNKDNDDNVERKKTGTYYRANVSYQSCSVSYATRIASLATLRDSRSAKIIEA